MFELYIKKLDEYEDNKMMCWLLDKELSSASHRSSYSYMFYCTLFDYIENEQIQNKLKDTLQLDEFVGMVISLYDTILSYDDVGMDLDEITLSFSGQLRQLITSEDNLKKFREYPSILEYIEEWFDHLVKYGY